MELELSPVEIRRNWNLWKHKSTECCLCVLVMTMKPSGWENTSKIPMDRRAGTQKHQIKPETTSCYVSEVWQCFFFFRSLDKGRFARKSSLEHMHNVSCFATCRTGELPFEETNAVRVNRLWCFSIFRIANANPQTTVTMALVLKPKSKKSFGQSVCSCSKIHECIFLTRNRGT